MEWQFFNLHLCGFILRLTEKCCAEKVARSKISAFLTENNDFKGFTCVLWQFMTKFAPFAPVFWCAMCKQG